MRYFVTDSVIQEERLYVYDIHNIIQNRFYISIAPVRSRGGSLVPIINLKYYI
jgi:hypothetical protein